MAGGGGTRFWPLSREERPKQFIDSMGIGKSFLQMTFERFGAFVLPEHYYVITGEHYKDLVLEQLPQLQPHQVITEPCRRNTAPCIAYAAYKIRSLDPEANLIVSPSDHYIADQTAFEEVIAAGLEYASEHDELLTIGITPTYPATEYGYIEVNPSGKIAERCVPVVRFKEKPDYDTAMKFLAAGNFYWNSGMFIWRTQSIISEMESCLPDMAKAFDQKIHWGGTSEREEANLLYPTLQSISIDYGVMERSQRIRLLRGNFGWNDIGTWGSLYRQMNKDEGENVLQGCVETTECHNCLVVNTESGKTVYLYRMADTMVVTTDDAIVVADRRNETDLNDYLKHNK